MSRWTAEPETRPITRVLDDAAGKALIDDRVPQIEPTVTKAGVYVDSVTDEPVLVYAPYPGVVAGLRRALLDTPMSTTLRGSSGRRNVSRTFGFRPKSIVLKFESCRPAAMATEAPQQHAVVVAAAREIDDWLRTVVPDVMRHCDQIAAPISQDWRLADGLYWTSGVINRSSALPYHRDRNNLPIWSAMPVVRRGVTGGHLAIPEYGQTIACRDGWLLAFNGAALTHGVTPIHVNARDGYRLSCVYYCLRGLQHCRGDDAAEQERARQRRTERERSIAAGNLPPSSMRTLYEPAIGQEPHDD